MIYTKVRWDILAVLVLLLTVHKSHAQENTVDSLKRLIEKEKEDTSRVLLLNKLAIIFQYSSPDKSMFFANKSLTLARQAAFAKGEGNSLTIIGNVFWATGNYPEALQYHLKALQIREKINDRRGMGVSYANLGNIYSEQKEETKALEFILKAKQIAEAINNEPLLASVITNGGDSYEKLNKLDSARLFAQLGYNLAERLDDNELMGLNLNNLGNIYAKMGQPVLAMGYYNSSIPKSIAGNNPELLCETKLGIAAILEKEGPTDSAWVYAQQSLATAQNNGFIKRIINAADFLSGYFINKNLIDSAFKYQKMTIAFKDSIFGQAKTREVQNLMFKEQLRQQELEESNRIALEKRKKNIMIIGIAAFLPLFFGLVLILSKRKVKPVIIEILGLLGLLLLFEFISLLIHPFIEIWTHNNPIYMLLILVCIAAFLIPLHHKLAEWVKKRLAHTKPVRHRRK